MRTIILWLAGVSVFGLTTPLLPQVGDQLREANRAASVLVLERLKSRDLDSTPSDGRSGRTSRPERRCRSFRPARSRTPWRSGTG